VPFYVDERAIVPRSFIAELLADGSIDDWLGEHTRRVLDLCTGNGSLAVLAAMAYPDVVDARRHFRRCAGRGPHQRRRTAWQQRVHADRVRRPGRRARPVRPDPVQPALRQRPEHGRAARRIPAEPELALAGGTDGMDFIRKLLREAPAHMSEHAVLVLEIGNERAHFEAAFPHCWKRIWLDTSAGDDQVLLPSRATPFPSAPAHRTQSRP
jgi:ribosomal protein L3 glutamine methyltransferase